MPRTRSSAYELGKLLDASTVPIYVLDEDRCIVYCNAACAAWIGLPAEELIGHTCAYHSQPGLSAPEAAAAALCPPPEVFLHQQRSAVVSWTTADGRASRRGGEFFPFARGSETSAAIIAILGPELPEVDSELVDTVYDDGARLHEAIRRYRQEARQRFALDRLIGTNPAILRARAQASLAAASMVNVLIVGPPGSGKEHLAKAIHYRRGGERAGSLVPLTCSALSAEMLGSTLRALAARQSPQGLERPGTLLLSDIDSLPPEVQGELINLLQAGSLAFSVIGTSRQSLFTPGSQETFRYDLACRLSTLVIELPALTERLEDLPLLAQLFLEEANARGGKQVGGFTPEALDQLATYSWPRNLDELSEMVQEAHQRAQGPEVTALDLPRRIQLALDAARFPSRAEETIDLEEFLERIERELIERALERAKGNKSKAAQLLGMTRPRLYRRLVQWGLVDEDSNGDPVE